MCFNECLNVVFVSFIGHHHIIIMADANAVDYSSMRFHTHLQSLLRDITDPGSPPPIDDRMDT